MDRSGANRGAVFEVPVIRTRLEHGFRDGWLAFLAFAFRFSNKRRDISSRGKGLSWLVRRLRGRLPRGERQGHRSRKSESETDYHGAHKTSKCTSRITLLSDPATGPFKLNRNFRFRPAACRIVRLSCPRHNGFAARARAGRTQSEGA